MKANNLKLIKHQRGLGMLQWLLVIIVVAIIGKFAFTVVPMYSENMYVQTALKSLDNDVDKLENMTDAEIKKKLTNFYMINNVRSDGPTKNIKIEREADKVLVKIDYEIRDVYMFNIDVVMSFQNHLDSTRPGQCCKPPATLKTK
ncbi:DUF4845 domain-containing protein [Cellvibrio sp. OA-2007]|uniref:DUF4845 domain-containing protein n=1 Tax=Cellvibrio sp. OA-2007 TaxID=529823 RepID=UPI0007849031|nr:DUF4845 domain-containing protein [Cellvibrio sp. OA-2007]|tara:strand:- start:87 stop:521 length:435 start_codon:yes stop_codon:yes gene_type:complete